MPSKGQSSSVTPKKRRTPTKTLPATDDDVSDGFIDIQNEASPCRHKLRIEMPPSPPPMPAMLESDPEETFDLELDLNPQLESEPETAEKHDAIVRKRSNVHPVNREEPSAKKKQKNTQSRFSVDIDRVNSHAEAAEKQVDDTQGLDLQSKSIHSNARNELTSSHKSIDQSNEEVGKPAIAQQAESLDATDEPQILKIEKSPAIITSKFFEDSPGGPMPRKILGKSVIKSENPSLDIAERADDGTAHRLTASAEQVPAAKSTDFPTIEEEKPERHESDEESEEEEDWEEVAVPGNGSEKSSTVAESQVSADEPYEETKFKTLTITLDTPKVKPRAKSSGLSKMERLIRLETHKAHLLCLLANGIYRNNICNNSELRALTLSTLPKKIYASLSLETRKDTATVKNSRFLIAIEKLASWWYAYFEVIGSECQTTDQEEVVESEEVADSMNLQHLTNSLNYPRGSAEVSTQLFVALCRAVGLTARLVISLQPAPLKAPTSSSKNGNSDVSSSASSPKTTKKSARRRGKQRSGVADVESGVMKTIKEEVTASKSKYFGQKREAEGEPPLFWAEILSPYNNKWVSVDCVRGLVSKVAEMEPSADNPYSLAYVVAYEADGCIKDVTRRYTRQWGAKTKKLRVPVAKDGYDWWGETLSFYARRYKSQADELEDAELLSCEVSEAMPTSIAAFNNHPLYVLERHLKKFEVLHPQGPVIGHIRGEPIYPRSCVKETHTTETWLKEGRTVKPGEEPVKYVKARVVTINKQRMHNMMAMDSGEAVDPQSALYGIWQTEEYRPPPVVDGKIPKNKFGNIDLYKDSMLPEGAVHLPFKGIARIAKKLEVDYAEAVVGFEFHCRRCIPVVKGIVVPVESKEIIMEAYEEFERNRQEKEFTKLEMAALAKWRKLITGLRIHHRLKEEYGNDPEEERFEEEMDDVELSKTPNDVPSPEPKPEIDTGAGFFL
ncbi:Rad4-domain-containing protein [Basidiobolus meristosporus CBS 931.73]|uniref:Rad4-domain-containing protein n=1 Tax=Basidiobolus meristosporus CBS 931.73 TaxID=1314790 RepID=A0A1Y1YC60_9FUNG|nr:Rad4-domain-containing protein [Basidiobolus meristosporus CBS 931.73]|eukprot:ORX95525.1 Rad4-domain-containing protein [Basidiobolus meristosporus CBS 931.73]